MLTVIELVKENMKFSAGHFTIFSATERERLHGHNYQVHAALTVKTAQQGLAFDYRFYKQKLYQLCRSLNEYVLLPANSAYLQLTEQGEYWHAHFNQQIIPFLKSDVLILPLTNITVEELSRWFIMQLTAARSQLQTHGIIAMTIKVFSVPGQSASAHWSEAEND